MLFKEFISFLIHVYTTKSPYCDEHYLYLYKNLLRPHCEIRIAAVSLRHCGIKFAAASRRHQKLSALDPKTKMDNIDAEIDHIFCSY